MSYLRRLLVALPLLSLALGALAWLRYGLDLPWFDDWRGYAEGNIHSLKLSYLFRPINDTLSPVGFALDALAQRYLDGNSIAYQFLSMVVVLGSLLWLQWKLLNKALGNSLHVAICFFFTVLMLQPGSYWGLENLAYYQCLPLVFILGAIWIIVCSDERKTWHSAVVFGLGLLAGFTYISGAFSAFAAGIALIGVARICYGGDGRRHVMRGAIWFTLASGFAVAVQFYFSVLKFQGTHAGIPMAFPSQAEFWFFYLGKMGRSLLLTKMMPAAALVIAALACIAAVVMAVFVVRRASAPQSNVQDKRLAAIYVSVAAVVFVYMMLVAAGRTNFRPPEMHGLMDIFTHAFTRFHFFWATLLWPWLVAAILVMVHRFAWSRQAAVQWTGVALVLVLVVLTFEGRAYSHMRSHRIVAGSRISVAHCLLQELQKGGEVRCPWLRPPRYEDLTPDSYPAYVYAREKGASFVRYFPLLADTRRRSTIPAFYQLGTDKPRMIDIEPLKQGFYRAMEGDPQIYLKTNQLQTLRQCTTLDIEVEMKIAVSDAVQVFFQPVGAPDYAEENSRSQRLLKTSDNAFQTVGFRLDSATGFQDTLRLDPVSKPQAIEIRDIRVYCVRRNP